MARGRLPMRKAKQVLAFHFEQGRSQRDIARHCGIARRSVALVLERFQASGLSWPEARELEEVALEEALYPPPTPESPRDDVNWAEINKAPLGPGCDAEVAVGGVAREPSRRDELSDLVPPLPDRVSPASSHDASGPAPGRTPGSSTIPG